MGKRDNYWVGYKKSVCLVTYKKVVDYKQANNCSWEDAARHFNLLKGQHVFIQEQHELFIDSKRIEEDRLLNPNYTAA